MDGQSHNQATSPSRKRYGTHCTAGWVGLRDILNRCREKKVLLSRGFEPRTAKSVGGRYDYSVPAPENIVKSSHKDEDNSSSSIIIYDLFNYILSCSNYIPFDVKLSVNNGLDTMSEKAVVAKVFVYL